MTEVPNFEERVLNKLDQIEMDLNDVKLTLARDYVTRNELDRTRREAVAAKRWAWGNLVAIIIAVGTVLIQLI